MRLLRHSLARLACGANMVCTQTRSTELDRPAKSGGRRFPRSARHRRAVGGAHPHINACGRTLANQVMGRLGLWPLGPDQRSGNQQLVSVVDPPEGFGVAPHVRVVDLHQTPMGSLHGGLGCAPGELKDG